MIQQANKTEKENMRGTETHTWVGLQRIQHQRGKKKKKKKLGV